MKLFRVVGVQGKLDRKLNRLIDWVGATSVRRFLEKLSGDLAHESLNLVNEGFDRGIDPSGKPWPRVKKAHRPLIDTGALRAGFVAESDFQGVRIRNTVPYAIVIQRGARFATKGHKNLAARKMLPDGKRLPLRWKERLAKVFHAHIEAFGEGAL